MHIYMYIYMFLDKIKSIYKNLQSENSLINR